MTRPVQLLLFLLLSYPILSTAGHYSRRATRARHFVRRAPVAHGSHAAVRMQLAQTERLCESAKQQAQTMLRHARPDTVAGLKDCAALYRTSVDLIESSMRALDANDGQSKIMVQIMVQQIRQSAIQCDYHFFGRRNPMGFVGGSIIKKTIQVDSINNMS